MSKTALVLALSLMSAWSWATPDAQPQADADGFTHPLSQLQINPALNQREFERATLQALDMYDPWMSWNLHVYHFNYRADQFVLLPLVRGYERVTPGFVRSGVGHFFSNLGDITNLFNNLLQFKGRASLTTAGRLALNTTVGVLGVWDPASKLGLERRPEDFGQTLGFYGVPSGPFLMLPLLGPSSLRDSAGLAVDWGVEGQINYLNMRRFSAEHPALYGLRGLNLRYNTPLRYGQLDSPFEYQSLRYIYLQSRQLMIGE